MFVQLYCQCRDDTVLIDTFIGDGLQGHLLRMFTMGVVLVVGAINIVLLLLTQLDFVFLFHRNQSRPLKPQIP